MRTFLSFSGGVMIYFDRIEVVNYLVPAAGTYMSVQQNKNISLPSLFTSSPTWRHASANICISLY